MTRNILLFFIAVFVCKFDLLGSDNMNIVLNNKTFSQCVDTLYDSKEISSLERLCAKRYAENIIANIRNKQICDKRVSIDVIAGAIVSHYQLLKKKTYETSQPSSSQNEPLRFAPMVWGPAQLRPESELIR